MSVCILLLISSHCTMSTLRYSYLNVYLGQPSLQCTLGCIFYRECRLVFTLFIVLNLRLHSLICSEEIVIRPAETECSNTTNLPCVTLSEYVQILKDSSVIQTTTVTFLSGDHFLNETWVIQNVDRQLSLWGQPSA